LKKLNIRLNNNQIEGKHQILPEIIR